MPVNEELDVRSTTTFLTPGPTPPLLDADLVLVFAERDVMTLELASALRRAHEHAVIVGCSTAGQFVADDLRDGDIAHTAISFDRAEVRSATAELENQADSADVGRKLGVALGRDDLRAVLVLSDGTTCNGTALVEGLAQQLGPGVTIFGGLAADGDAFERTVVLADDRVRSEVVTAVGFSGASLTISTGSEGGWDPFGPERTITASDGAVLHELDGEPALGLYSRYLGDRADQLPGSALLFPLAIREP